MVRLINQLCIVHTASSILYSHCRVTSVINYGMTDQSAVYCTYCKLYSVNGPHYRVTLVIMEILINELCIVHTSSSIQ